MTTKDPGSVVCFGETMLRLSSPGPQLLLQTPVVDVTLAGAEANVAVALAQLGRPSAIVSAVPNNALGEAARRTLRGHGVDCSHLRVGDGRMGLYWVENGASLRAPGVIYDRADSAFARCDPASWTWPTLLAGASRLHLSGITPALSASAAQACLEAVRASTELGVRVSFDVNFRPNLWANEGAAREKVTPLVAHADILIGNDRDLALLLDCAVPDKTEAGFGLASAMFERFERLEMIAATRRAIEAVDRHRLAAIVQTRDAWYCSEEIVIPSIVDRIGTGDAFSAGVLLSRDEGGDLAEIAATALALAAMKHSMAGDQIICSRASMDQFRAGRLEIRR